MKAKTFIISALLLSFASLALAGDVNINRCGMRIANALNRLEIKGASALDIIEVKIDKPIDYIFGERKLTLAPLESKFAEKKALYRYPGVASKVRDRFETVKFIENMPDKDLAKLLEPNTIYTYTIQDKKLSIAKSKPGIIRDFASKHMLLSADESAGDLRMAGEMWVDDKGILHYDPGSGTYKPGNEDLKRAEVFFKSHLGIEASQAHFFEAPVQTAATSTNAPAKSSLTSKIKQIEAAQITILQKRRVLSGYKFSIVSKQRMEETERKLQKNFIMKDIDGKEAQYKLIKLEQLTTEAVDFDDAKGTLAHKSGILRQSRTYDPMMEDKLQPMQLKSSDSAVKYAVGNGVKKSDLIPIGSTKNEETVYGVYRVGANGALSKTPVINIMLNRVTTSNKVLGHKTDYSASIVNDSSSSGLYDEAFANQIKTELELN